MSYIPPDTNDKRTVEEAYSFAAFDEPYYEQVLCDHNPAGFKFDERLQQAELANKWEQAKIIGFEPKTALFVGCAKGFEVKTWHNHGVRALGMDVSEWALSKAPADVADSLFLYKGGDFVSPKLGRLDDDGFDAVFAFDVLSLVPRVQRATIIDEMIRVARLGIVIRTVVQFDPGDQRPVHAWDGVPFRKETEDWWVEQFCRGNKFKLKGKVSERPPPDVTTLFGFTRP